MPGNGGSDRSNSQRLRDEYPWLWAIRREWIDSDSLTAKAPTAGDFSEKIGDRELWIKLEGARTEYEKTIRVYGEDSIAKAAILACDPEWNRIAGIALVSNAKDPDNVKVEVWRGGNLHHPCLVYGLHYPAYEANQRALNSRE